MTKSGFDIDEIERLLDEGLCDPENLCEEGFAITAGIIDQVPAMIAEIRKLRWRTARLREMTATNKQAWDNALELGIIPERYSNTVRIMSDGCRAALGEPQ